MTENPEGERRTPRFKMRRVARRDVNFLNMEGQIGKQKEWEELTGKIGCTVIVADNPEKNYYLIEF